MEKVLPNNVDAEHAILGAIIKDSSIYSKVSSVLSREMFYLDTHKEIYTSIDLLSLEGKPIDLLTVAEKLKQNDLLDTIGGNYYLAKLIGSVVNLKNIEHHCKLIKDKFILRAIIYTAKNLENSATHEKLEDVDLYLSKLQSYTNNSAGSLAEEIREWILSTNGNFLSTDVYNCLQLSTRSQKKNVSEILRRLCESKLIEKDGKQNGKWRRVEDEEEVMDIYAPDEPKKDIVLPFQLDNLCYLHPRNIMIIAGVSETGKTAWMLNIAKQNQHKNKVFYFSSEMGNKELKSRLQNFDYGVKDFEKVTFINRSSNFEDVIRPADINIIDFLEIHEEHYKIGVILKRIYEKLTTGIAIISIQKDAKKEFGVGGNVTQEKARIYLNLDHQEGYSTATIVKGKNWGNPMVNPSKRKLDYWVINGSKLKQKSGWYKDGEKEIPVTNDFKDLPF